MLRLFFCCLASFLLVTGCDPDVRSLQYEDENNPYIQRALNHVLVQDYKAATESYEEALAANPKLVQPHYEVAILYHDKLSDLISAMYHYNRYLQLASDPKYRQNRFIVQTRLNNAQAQFAVTLPYSTIQNADALAKLQETNAQLTLERDNARKQLEKVQSRLDAIVPPRPDGSKTSAAKPSAAPSRPTVKPTTVHLTKSTPTPLPPSPPLMDDPETSPTPEPSPSPHRPSRNNSSELPTLAPGLAEAKPTPRASSITPTAAANAQKADPSPTPDVPPHPEGTTHTVEKGDSLWKIASLYYPKQIKEGMEKLRAANPESFGPGKQLKPGQILIIP